MYWLIFEEPDMTLNAPGCRQMIKLKATKLLKAIYLIYSLSGLSQCSPQNVTGFKLLFLGVIHSQTSLLCNFERQLPSTTILRSPIYSILTLTFKPQGSTGIFTPKVSTGKGGQSWSFHFRWSKLFDWTKFNLHPRSKKPPMWSAGRVYTVMKC